VQDQLENDKLSDLVPVGSVNVPLHNVTEICQKSYRKEAKELEDILKDTNIKVSDLKR
jgi:hypothetical protein